MKLYRSQENAGGNNGMRIAVDVLSIREDGSAGGATGFAIELIRGLADEPGNIVFALCADWNIDLLKEILPKKIRFLQIAGADKQLKTGLANRILSKLRYKIKANGILHANKIDVLCCPFSAVGNREEGIPVVSTILDIQHEFYPQFFDKEEVRNRPYFYANVLRKADWIVCISNYTKETFCSRYRFPKERATTIYIAIQNRFKDTDDSICERLGLERNNYIVYPANFWKHKNHKLLLNAFGMYIFNGGKGKLVLSGNTLGQDEYFLDVINKLGLKDKVVVTGYLSNQELHGLFRGMKGLIFPSLFEGFGIPVVEAMYFHKLIASSNLTSLPEIGCDSIFYFNPKKPDEVLDAINYLFRHEMTFEMTEDYDKKLVEYHPQIMIQKYMDVFKLAIANRRSDEDDGKYDWLDETGGRRFRNEVVLRDGSHVFYDGIYEDKWSGKTIQFQIEGDIRGCIRIVLFNPEFVNRRSVVRWESNGVAREEVLQVGDEKVIEFQINDIVTKIVLDFPALWTPRKVLKVDDNRKLGLQVKSVTIESAGINMNIIE